MDTVRQGMGSEGGGSGAWQVLDPLARAVKIEGEGVAVDGQM